MKRFSILIATFMLIFTVLYPVHLNAKEVTVKKETKYWEDGSYYEITLIETSGISGSSSKNRRKRLSKSRLPQNLCFSRPSTKSGRKTVIHKSSRGRKLWSVTVHGTFSYTGKSAKCTYASVSTSCPSRQWKIVSSSSSKRRSTAAAKATAKKYINGKVKQTIIKSIFLRCSTFGKLS